MPPGVELQISEPYLKKNMTSYLKTYKRNITVTGPLGEQNGSLSARETAGKVAVDQHADLSQGR